MSHVDWDDHVISTVAKFNLDQESDWYFEKHKLSTCPTSGYKLRKSLDVCLPRSASLSKAGPEPADIPIIKLGENVSTSLMYKTAHQQSVDTGGRRGTETEQCKNDRPLKTEANSWKQRESQHRNKKLLNSGTTQWFLAQVEGQTVKDSDNDKGQITLDLVNNSTDLTCAVSYRQTRRTISRRSLTYTNIPTGQDTKASTKVSQRSRAVVRMRNYLDVPTAGDTCPKVHMFPKNLVTITLNKQRCDVQKSKHVPTGRDFKLCVNLQYSPTFRASVTRSDVAMESRTKAIPAIHSRQRKNCS